MIGSDGAVHYYIADRLGHVLGLVDTAGALTDQYLYSPFGVEAPLDLSGNPFRYTGRRFDAETELYHYRARMYDPAWGRFLQTDPIGYEDQMNLYAYVGNDPLNAVDPYGLFECTEDGDVKECRGTKEELEEIAKEIVDFIGRAGRIEVEINPSQDEVEQTDDHVRTLMNIFGPASERREYFGFIYSAGNVLGSSIARGARCRASAPSCMMRSSEVQRANDNRPSGSRLRGEWHTHPQESGSPDLSQSDATSANFIYEQLAANSRPYYAYYSAPNGIIYRWDASVNTEGGANASRTQIGRYR